MNLSRTPTHTLYGSVAYGGSMNTVDIKSHIEAMFESSRPAPEAKQLDRWENEGGTLPTQPSAEVRSSSSNQVRLSQ
ncbi:hypothetical protein HYG77_31915 (plasmid) [Rhodococcus sp. ZPP]|uniref:hypothetical protein n=1 Tax=Rhodococcus sp. ZPP TaxID=2749906 RepID=UPI001AD8648C|nr:hypothetical protein [Rhodococcus sp. ZPP]QTJ70190.1 hypothetical protein HYG77_31915 [Rhodococcus sp. ZPP]